jgi:hypothetical protein
LKNAGPGVAFNVGGELWGRSRTGQDPYQASLHAGTLGPGDEIDARVASEGVRDWIGVVGALTYDDAKGRHWQTSFVVQQAAGGLVIISHDPLA